MGFKFAIDRGGTFTDVYARCPNGNIHVLKLLSENPGQYNDAPLEAIRRIMCQELGVHISPNGKLDAGCIDFIRMGTTIATNALLERKGEPCVLAVTEGFKDVLTIGDQSRPDIFDLKIDLPTVLYNDVIELKERVWVHQKDCELQHSFTKATAITGEQILVEKPLDVDAARLGLQRAFDKGIRSVAIALMHSYIYPNHELILEKIARDIGFVNTSLSHQVMPMARLVPRASTAVVDAYLTPRICAYVESFSNGFRNGLDDVRVMFMQSDGGLAPAHTFFGSRAILSGPAGGVIGYAMTSYSAQLQQPVVGFDMGGTSTDVSRYGGELEHVFETITGGVRILAPQLNVKTVAAGGGSCLSFQGGLYKVGPESAGSFPGPVAYGYTGGKLTVTDANLILGRLLPSHFPSIFGPRNDSPLNKAAAREAFSHLVDQINAYTQSHDPNHPAISLEEASLGFIRVANETMCRPIRSITQGKGYDTSKHILACFGGAGGQHACAIARNLGIRKVLIHRYAGILSAYGMMLADVVREEQLPCHLIYEPSNFGAIDGLIDRICEAATNQLLSEGFEKTDIVHEVFLHMRFDRTDCTLMCQASNPADTPDDAVQMPRHGDFKRSFFEKYKREFGFILCDRNVLVDDVRVRGRAVTPLEQQSEIPRAEEDVKPEPVEITQTYFDQGFMDTAVYLLDHLLAGHQIAGPAFIISPHSTILIEPYCVATISRVGNIEIEINYLPSSTDSISTHLDPIRLSIFSHRFMSIAEQMGKVLQQTAISTNIKERLDFSCALFAQDGGLVANAPHIPVHLGAMQHAVQYQIDATGNQFSPGEVLLSNHPCAGGSHLPDLTVITPVFVGDARKPAFFVANRGHHADIGGSTPGSMPPHSKCIFEEGAVFKSFYLVKDGRFQEEAVTAALMAPAQYSGCSGTRSLSDNLSDLRAQIAANQKGVFLLQQLIEEYGLSVVQAYMHYIQDNAERSVRHMLQTASLHASTYTDTALADSSTLSQSESSVPAPNALTMLDYMDDGTPIHLRVTIDSQTGSAHFDFTGTGPEVLGNTNTPRAVLLSCLFYTLRSLVGGDICLNHGCLKPVKITVPPGTILSASPNAAVVGGNVITSQRLVDVILGAFRACAASQGCMNNLTFGTNKFVYYETVAGGAGAGPGWHGRNGIHTHMTNTRITDPEILELRYPVILDRFSLRHGSGGAGRWRGGDGLIRRLKFRNPVTLSILSERRAVPPYGLCGGNPGQRGLNLLLRSGSPHPINIGGKATVDLSAGDVFILQSPGGGGFGQPIL